MEATRIRNSCRWKLYMQGSEAGNEQDLTNLRVCVIIHIHTRTRATPASFDLSRVQEFILRASRRHCDARDTPSRVGRAREIGDAAARTMGRRTRTPMIGKV